MKFYLLISIIIVCLIGSSFERKIRFHHRSSKLYDQNQLFLMNMKEKSASETCPEGFFYYDLGNGDGQCYEICTETMKCKKGEICRKFLIEHQDLYCIPEDKYESRNKASSNYMKECENDFDKMIPKGEKEREGKTLICLKKRWRARCSTYQDCLIASPYLDKNQFPKVTCGPIDHNPFYGNYNAGLFSRQTVSEKYIETTEFSIFGHKFKNPLSYLAKNYYCIVDHEYDNKVPELEEAFQKAKRGEEVDEKYEKITKYLLQSSPEMTTLRAPLAELNMSTEEFNKIAEEVKKLSIENIPSLGFFFEKSDEEIKKENEEKHIEEVLSKEGNVNDEEYEAIKKKEKERMAKERDDILDTNQKQRKVYEEIKKEMEKYQEEGKTAKPFDEEMIRLFGGKGKGLNLGDYCDENLSRFCYKGLICKNHMCTTPCDEKTPVCSKYKNPQIKCTLYHPGSSKRYCYDEGFTKRNPNKDYLKDCDEIGQFEQTHPENKELRCYHGSWTRTCHENRECLLYRGAPEYTDIECVEEYNDLDIIGGIKSLFYKYKNVKVTEDYEERVKKAKKNSNRFHLKFCNSVTKEKDRLKKLSTGSYEIDDLGRVKAGKLAKFDSMLFNGLNTHTTNELLVTFGKGYNFAILDSDNMLNILELFYSLKDKKFPDNSEIFKGLNNQKTFAALTAQLENDINKQTFINKNEFTPEKPEYLDLYFKFIGKQCRDYDTLYNEFKTWSEKQLTDNKKNGVKYTKIIDRYKLMTTNLYDEFTHDLEEVNNLITEKKNETKYLKNKELHRICGSITEDNQILECYDKVKFLDKPIEQMEHDRDISEMINKFSEWEIECLEVHKDNNVRTSMFNNINRIMQMVKRKNPSSATPRDIIKEITDIGFILLKDFCSPFHGDSKEENALYCENGFLTRFKEWANNKLADAIFSNNNNSNLQLAIYNIIFEFANYNDFSGTSHKYRENNIDHLARAKKIGALMGFAIKYFYKIDRENSEKKGKEIENILGF